MGGGCKTGRFLGGPPLVFEFWGSNTFLRNTDNSQMDDVQRRVYDAYLRENKEKEEKEKTMREGEG